MNKKWGLMLGQQQDKLFGAWGRFRTHERGSPVFPKNPLRVPKFPLTEIHSRVSGVIFMMVPIAKYVMPETNDH
jgi:hypothetical protein